MKSLKKVFAIIVMAFICASSNAQIRYYANGRLTYGNTTPYGFYAQTIYGTGTYYRCHTNNFFQIDVTPAAPRLAGHGDEVVFYNTQTSTFNSLQVQNVYNYSDARAKTEITPLSGSLSSVMMLRPVTYKFINSQESLAAKKGGDGKEIGLLAQEVEAIFPNVVITDDEGKKLINYTALIPVLIDAIQTLQSEVENLKNK